MNFIVFVFFIYIINTITIFVQCFEFPDPHVSIAVKRLSVETMNLGVEDHHKEGVELEPLDDSISNVASRICNTFAHIYDDKRCISTAHHTIRSLRTNLVTYARDSLRNSNPHAYNEKPSQGLTIGFSYIYDKTMTEDKTICIFGRFSLQLYTYIRLYSGAKNVHYFNRMGRSINYGDDAAKSYFEYKTDTNVVNSADDYEISALLSEDPGINSLTVHLDNYHNLMSIIEAKNTQGLLSQCDIVHIRENKQSTVIYINNLIAKAVAQSYPRDEGDATTARHQKEALVAWERVIDTDTENYNKLNVHNAFQHKPFDSIDLSTYTYIINWNANINTQSIGTYSLRMDSQGFYSRALHPEDITMETEFAEIVLGYSQYYSGNYKQYTGIGTDIDRDSIGNSNQNSNGNGNIHDYSTLISLFNQKQHFHSGINVRELPDTLNILKKSIISQYYRAWSDCPSCIEQSIIDTTGNGYVDFNHYSNQPIMITYTCRVFGETSRGLQLALFELGYKYVFIVPDLTLEYYYALKSYMQHTLALEYAPRGLSVNELHNIDLMQIVIAPLDIQVLLPTYVAIQLEQVWSPFFTHFYDRYSRILRNAVGVWSYSEKLSRDLFNGGILPVHAFSVPVLADTTRNKQLVQSYKDLTKQFRLSKAQAQSQTNTDSSTPTIDTPDAPDAPVFSFVPPIDDDYYIFDALIFGGGSGRRSDIVTGLFHKLYELHNNQSLEFKYENGVQMSIGEGRIAILSQKPLRIGYAIGSWDTLIFDDDRDFYIQRSKTILNIHSEADSSLELHRVNYLLSMGK